jgi:hypothetical protein
MKPEAVKTDVPLILRNHKTYSGSAEGIIDGAHDLEALMGGE